MEIVLALIVGVLVAAGTYLFLRRHLLQLFFGFVLLSNAVNVLLFTMGRLTRAAPPLIRHGHEVPEGVVANPLAQALILTSIVISFGFQAFLLVLIYRSHKTLETVDAEELATGRDAAVAGEARA